MLFSATATQAMYITINYIKRMVQFSCDILDSINQAED